jgi:hypothetical protein
LEATLAAVTAAGAAVTKPIFGFPAAGGSTSATPAATSGRPCRWSRDDPRRPRVQTAELGAAADGGGLIRFWDFKLTVAPAAAEAGSATLKRDQYV